MQAWWIYWLTVAVAAVLWIGVPLIAGRDGLLSLLEQPVGLAILVLPLVAAGVNLIVYRASHEEICPLEVERHPSLRHLVGRGYSARTFAWTGGALLVLAGVIVAAVIGSGYPHVSGIHLPVIAPTHQPKVYVPRSAQIGPICLPWSRLGDQGQVVGRFCVRLSRHSDNGKV